MKQHKNIFIIGSSHVADESVKKVISASKELFPDIIALELDRNRFFGLKHNLPRPKNLELVKRIGFAGFIFYVFGEFIQKKVGKLVRLEPGSEMLAAIRFAEENKRDIALIDQDISITLRKFSRSFTIKEVGRLTIDLVSGPFRKSPIEVDLSKVPSEKVISLVVSHVKERYPSIYKVLIHERNVIMARKLHALSLNHPDKKILAVVGAGHLQGMMEELGHLSKENFK